MDTSTIQTSLPVMVPVMTVKQYAQNIGLSVGTVQGWIKRGHVPTVKIGKHRMINLYQLAESCAKE